MFPQIGCQEYTHRDSYKEASVHSPKNKMQPFLLQFQTCNSKSCAPKPFSIVCKNLVLEGILLNLSVIYDIHYKRL